VCAAIVFGVIVCDGDAMSQDTICWDNVPLGGTSEGMGVWEWGGTTDATLCCVVDILSIINWRVLSEESAGAELNEYCMAADAVCWASDPVGVIDGVLLI